MFDAWMAFHCCSGNSTVLTKCFALESVSGDIREACTANYGIETLFMFSVPPSSQPAAPWDFVCIIISPQSFDVTSV